MSVVESMFTNAVHFVRFVLRRQAPATDSFTLFRTR